MKKQYLLLTLFMTTIVNAFSMNNIIDIRNSFTQAAALGANMMITGVVINDNGNANNDAKNMFIQDATGGIVVRFAAAHSFLIGDSVTVDVSSQTISEYNGLLEIGGTSPNVPLANATKVGTGVIVPRVATLAQLKSNMAGTTDTWESTLVTVNNVTINGAGNTYLGTLNLIQGTDTLLMFTRTAATFSGAIYPTTSVNITGILGDFNAAQLLMRSLNDVVTVTGLNNLQDISSSVKLLSNPVVHSLKLQLPSSFTNTDFASAKISIMDISGRNIYSGEISSSLVEVDVNAFKAGLYTYLIEIGNKKASGKFIVQ